MHDQVSIKAWTYTCIHIYTIYINSTTLYSVIGNLGAVVEYRPVPELADPDIISESVPVHLMYGPLSAICIIINADKNHENLNPNNNYINYKDSDKNADNDKCNMISNYIDKSDYTYNNIDNSNYDNYHHNSNNIDNNNTSVNDDKCNDLANDDSSTTTMNKISPTEGIMVRILKVNINITSYKRNNNLMHEDQKHQYNNPK
jgi:hypothetical protein